MLVLTLNILPTHNSRRFRLSQGADMSDFHSSQWDMFRDNQVGTWKGVHAGYDPSNTEVADYLYCETKMELSPDSTSMAQTNAFVVGEIRTDCEVCFDSERVKTKNAGIFSSGRLIHRVCDNAAMKGPFPTPRGMSLEITIREPTSLGDGRIRVLFGYSPINMVDLDMLDAPASLLLKDMVVVRERLGVRPLDLPIEGGGPDAMWSIVDEAVFSETKYRGIRKQCTASGEIQATDITPGFLPELGIGKDMDEHVVGEERSELFCRILPGGIKVEVPWVLLSHVPSDLRISWMPCASQGSRQVFAVGTTVEPNIESNLDDGTLRVLPAKVSSLFIEHLEAI
jgi:hypothetical protein